MKKLMFIFFVFVAIDCFAVDDEYAVSKISSTLMQNANVVVRREEQRFEMKSLEKAVEYTKIAFTILNENGDEYAGIIVPYDKFNTIDFIEGSLYDANGKKIKSLKKSDIADKSANSEFANDNRYKEYNFYCKSYPYTVVYEYSVICKETMFFPKWFPLVIEDCAVEESRFIVTVPVNYQLRYKMFNYKSEPQVQEQGDKKTYQWIATNLPATKQKYGFPGWRYVMPMVLTGASDFQIEDYKGSMLSWEEMGKFIIALNSGRDVLPENIRTKIKELTTGLSTVQEKVRTLYEFLQQNTRYISVQLGIGGWRPFEAAYVAKNGYGDCKALSNYMYSILKEAGIRSHYALIRAGENTEDIVTDFPGSQFNHAILCVPDGKDTIWLECTSQDAVAGYMGQFTGNRHALLITEEGGKLVRTQNYTAKENYQTRKINALINPDGSVTAESFSDYYGLMQEDYHDLIHRVLNKEKLKEFLQDNIALSTFEILDYKYKQDRTKNPKVNEQLKIAISNYCQVSGKRIFINPNILNQSSFKLPVEERTYPIWLKNNFMNEDSVSITVPAGYKAESIPAKTEISSQFGTYKANYVVEKEKVVYYRRFERNNGFFKPESYADLVKFYDQVYKADRSKVVLVKE